MAAPSNASKKTGVVTSFVSVMFLVIGVVTLLPTTIIIVIGMLPTAVATFADNSRERLAGLTLGCMNVAGVLPPLLALWHEGHTVENALGILMQPYMLLLMYGGAALGLVLYINTPLMLSGLLRKQASFRLKAIERQHADLREEWGPDVDIDVDTNTPASTAAVPAKA